MKKLYFAVATLAALSLASCTQKLETETSGSQPFEITVNAPTKTAVDADWNVTWEASDEIKAVINSTDVTFTNNGGNKFVTKDFAPEAGTEYSWSLLYHKDSKYFTAAKIGKDGYTTGFFGLPTTTVQKTASDKSHLGGQPLCGYATTTGTESPAVKMNHLTTVIVVKVTNSTSADLKISEIIAENDSDAAMSGTFYINCAEGKVKEKSPVTSVSMSVTDGTIAAGATAEFYIPAAPFTIAAGKNITITLKVGDKKAEFVKNISAGKTFAAGEFNTTSVTVDAQSLADDTIKKLTVAEFIAKEVSSTTWYQLTGIVTNLTSTTYGNFDLKDETGTVYIYGLTQTQVANNDKSFSKIGLKVGDEVTIITLRGEYNGTAQGGGKTPAYYVSHKPAKAFTAALDKASVTSDAGTATIKITADADVKWTITNDNETIFSLSETSGTGSKDVTVTYTANESTTDSRIANFVVSTSDFVATSSYSLKLTQLAVGVVPVETKTYTLKFGKSYNGKSVNNYTTTWTATVDNFTWNLVNWNNNQNGWTYVKCGPKNAESSASIATSTAIIEPIKTIVITLDNIANGSVSSIALQTATKSGFSDAKTIETKSSVSQGNVSFSIQSPSDNMFYKLVFNCKNTTKKNNGVAQVSKITYSNE